MPTAPIKIPIASPDLTSLEKRYLMEAYESGWISSKGIFVERFEEAFAKWLGVNYAITCCNGTAALHLAALALGIKPDEEIYVTPNSYEACRNVVKYIGAKVRSYAVDKQIVVHNYGYFTKPASGFKLIEDCAEALGTRYTGKLAGTFGDLSTFSFYGNKTITTGEGGMVCTNRRDYALTVSHLKNQAMVEPYIHDQVGYNYRMTNLQAAIGLGQLERIDELVDKKRVITKLYKKYLAPHFRTPEITSDSDPVIWMNVFYVDNSVKFRRFLAERGIETRPGFDLASNLVMLPSGTKLTEPEIKEVCKIANAYT